MTESDWLAATDPSPMLAFLQSKASDRKVRLFVVACARRVGHLLGDASDHHLLDVAERFADGAASEGERSRAWQSVGGSVQPEGPEVGPAWYAAQAAFGAAMPGGLASFGAALAAGAAAAAVSPRPGVVIARSGDHIGLHSPPYGCPVVTAERAVQAALLRDIIGPRPIRPVALDPCWQTSTVVGLAATIYADRAFDHLPILADALEDTGCDDADILGHCRGEGLSHVRGCWCVDLVLGKE